MNNKIFARHGYVSFNICLNVKPYGDTNEKRQGDTQCVLKQNIKKVKGLTF